MENQSQRATVHKSQRATVHKRERATVHESQGYAVHREEEDSNWQVRTSDNHVQSKS